MKDRYHIDDNILAQIKKNVLAKSTVSTKNKSAYKTSPLPSEDIFAVHKNYVPFGKPQMHCDSKEKC